MRFTRGKFTFKKALRASLWTGLALLTGAIIFVARASFYELPEALREPPLAIPTSTHAGMSVSLSLMPPGKAFSTYTDYMQFQLNRNPRQEAARLYIESLQRFDSDKIADQFLKVFYDANDELLLYTLPYSPNQIQWLHRQQGFINLAHRLIRSTPLPHPSLMERSKLTRRLGNFMPEMEFLLMQYCARMMVAESLSLWQQGEFSKARQAMQDVYALADQCRDEGSLINQLIDVAMISIANHAVALQVGDAAYPDQELQKLRDNLEQIELKLFPADVGARMIMADYFPMRQFIVHEMEQPTWKSMIYGWGGIERVGESFCGQEVEYWFYADLPLVGTEKLPYIPKMIAHATRAMNWRLDSAAALREFDAFHLRFIELAKGPFARYKAAVPEFDKPETYKHFLMRRMTPNLFEAQARWRVAVAHMHLNRAGMALRLDGREAANRERQNARENFNHPWRDPFSDEALKRDEQSSGTLIYSVGPDLLDQHGTITYDPSNGTVSAGDIMLRVGGAGK